jgi:ferredoxin
MYKYTIAGNTFAEGERFYMDEERGWVTVLSPFSSPARYFALHTQEMRAPDPEKWIYCMDSCGRVGVCHPDAFERKKSRAENLGSTGDLSIALSPTRKERE